MTRRADKAATIRDVAAAARVAIATASRALTGSGPVNESTRRRVEAAARRLAYLPSPQARRLRGAPAKTIGVLVPAMAPLYAEWLRGASEVARRNGYVLLVCDGENSMRLTQSQVARLLEERVSGLLLAGSTPAPREIARALDAGIPIGPDLSRRQRGRPLQETQFRPATLAAFRHVVGAGHRRIAYLMGVERDEGYASTLQRMRVACLQESLAEVGVQEQLAVVPSDPLDGAATAACVQRLVESDDAPTAIVAGVPMLTAPVLRGLRAARRRIPDDVSVLAFDESGWEDLHAPAIAVVRHDYRGIAAALTEDLIARIEGRAASGPHPSTFRCEFVPGGSIGRPRVG